MGEKIKVYRLLEREITVHEYRIEPSKKIENDTCLHMQISLNEVKHVVFTSSKGLQNMIKQVDRLDFPFTATIVEINKEYLFT